MASSSRKQKRTRASAVEFPEASPPASPKPVVDSGHPFIEGEVDWRYERIHLLEKPHKVIPGGYETMAMDVNKVLRLFPFEQSAYGCDVQQHHFVVEYEQLRFDV